MRRAEDTQAARRQALRDDWARLREALAQAGEEASAFVVEQVDARPLLAAGAAAGVGFLLGGGTTRHGLALLLGLGARMAAAPLGEELASALRQRGKSAA